jgi:DHA2 family multidrug resistance protein-like MFS transporter
MIAPSAGESSLAIVIAGFALLALGLAPVFTLATDIIVGAAPAERAGSASAISETGSELGGALGIAVLGSICTAAYRGTIAHSTSAVVPPDSVEAVRRTLGGAVSVAEHLPPTIASQLVDSAREAFSRSLDVVSLTAAGIAIATAILVMVALRSVPPADQR